MNRTAFTLVGIILGLTLNGRAAADQTSAAESSRSFSPVCAFLRDSILEPKQPFELVPGKDPNGWTFVIEPYLWATALSGTTQISPGPAIAINASAKNLLQNLDWGVMAMAEARKGRWGILADGFYAELSPDVKLGGTFYNSADLNVQQAFASLALAYRVIDDRRGFVDLYAGARYNYMGLQAEFETSPSGIAAFADGFTERLSTRIRSVVAEALPEMIGKEPDLRRLLARQRLGSRFGRSQSALRELIKAEAIAQINPTAKAQSDLKEAKKKFSSALANDIEDALPQDAAGDQWWVDPIVGLRGQLNFTRWLYLTLQSDVGGFGAGSQITWNVLGALGANFTRNVFGELGYRYMYVDYNRNGVLYDMNSYGIFMSIGFKF
jgi:hypothetical protein